MAKDGRFHISRNIAQLKSNKLGATGKEANKEEEKEEENNPELKKRSNKQKSHVAEKIRSSPHHPILQPQ